MKRSEVNQIIDDAEVLLSECGFVLPPFGSWSPADWSERPPEEVSGIVAKGLGWDITDFGKGDFAHTGLCLFTLRNGSLGELQQGKGKVYAEKIMMSRPSQVTPMHFHWAKTEDIINRGGGPLVVQVYGSSDDEGLSEEPVSVEIDSVTHTLPPGEILELGRGQSITMYPGVYHSFWGASEDVLVGEVSSVNDDATDNRFLESVGRFPSIDEDASPSRLLVPDYGPFLK